ncbi:MAG: hypothetical protein DWQ37_13910 [Planctomycetota bacterium]|nr:MAG: hypothetical protein DWQ37_13910 [Planctomycetota bacterium]
MAHLADGLEWRVFSLAETRRGFVVRVCKRRPDNRVAGSLREPLKKCRGAWSDGEAQVRLIQAGGGISSEVLLRLTE